MGTAYPRSRGGTSRDGASRTATTGLSPLARGNRIESGQELAHGGPIPARAGEPPQGKSPRTHAGAYPRSRGGTLLKLRVRHGCKGLSPLARGNHDQEEFSLCANGPIPARAGEPFGCCWCYFPFRAYPRSRGGTACPHADEATPRGLSPLARGNHSAPDLVGARVGPIPARAGEPSCINSRDL